MIAFLILFWTPKTLERLRVGACKLRMQSCRLRTEYSVGDTQSTRYLQPAQCSWQRRHSCPPSATGEPSWHICLGNLVFCCWPFWRPAARQLEKYRRSLGNDQRDSARRRDICGPVLADYERHEGRYPGTVVGRLGARLAQRWLGILGPRPGLRDALHGEGSRRPIGRGRKAHALQVSTGVSVGRHGRWGCR
jgi:hypothetical protein